LDRLGLEVEAELHMVESAAATAESPAMWQFDPTDVERERVGLQSLLGAVDALAGRPIHDPDGPTFEYVPIELRRSPSADTGRR
jgi:hypothetical protein